MTPLPGWVIILPEEKKMQGLLELPDTAQSIMQQGVIIEISDQILKDGKWFEMSLFGIKKGDTVAFKKYYDNDLQVGSKLYKVVHLDNIFSTI